ncbi:MAG: hypothetical protein E7J43_00195 [Finegoldia magna]|nr:hypothetical protein [Finegoldia magna]
MKIKVLKEFYDKKESVMRYVGDTFIVSQERYREIYENLKAYCSQCKWIEEVTDGHSTKTSKNTVRDKHTNKR